jgi:CTP:molybdopterin cytidylyltransferase MocA
LIAAVILAAGGSARFGYPKQLLTHQGENLVRRAAIAAINAKLDPVIVVLGAYASTIVQQLAGLDAVTVVENATWMEGQATSLLLGIQAATSAGADAALVMLADQPLIDSDALAKLIGMFDEKHRLVASHYSGTIGAPAIFGSEFFNDLKRLSGDQGAGKWLRARSEEVTTVDLAEAATDIDTPDDLKHLRFD